MDEEMRAHVALRTQQNIEAGMLPEEARHAALKQFGWTESIKEDCRDQRGIDWLDHLVQDVRHGVRMLAKHPGFTTVSVLTLALGIGVNTSVFSVTNAILFRALPYAAPEQLTRVYRASPQSDRQSHSVPDFLDYQAQQTLFEDMAGFAAMDVDFNEPGQPAERLRSMLVSASFLPLLRAQPALGRAFTPDEDRHNPNVVILSHGFWISRFGRDPSVIGRTLQLNRTPATVVGVLPAGFDYPLLWGQVDIWRPIGFPPGMRMNANRGNAWFQVIGRLKAGVSLNQARAEMNTIAARLAKDHPETNARGGLRVLPLRASTGDEPSRRVTGLTMGLAAFVLLIACANLANLQFARASGRAREYAIRAALGAGRGQLTRQLLTESLLLAAFGGALGIGLAAACNQVLGRQIIVAGQTGLTVPLDPLVLGFALVVSVLTGVVFGVVPAWTAARAGVNSGLRECARGSTTSRSGNRLRHALIVAEVALALVLLSGAGLFLRGLERFTHRHPGWNVDGLLTAHVTLPNTIYARNGRRGVFYERLREQLKALPGVENAALSWSVPVGSHSSSRRVAIDGQPKPPPGLAPVASYQGVSPGYFDTLGMRLRAGRDFTAQDGATNAPPVVIINEAMARAFWPNESALGQRIAFEHPQVGYQRGMEVIGVVNDIVLAANLAPPETRFQAYRPLAREESAHVAVTLRSTKRPEVLADGLRRVVAGLDAQQPVHEIVTARQAAGRLLANYSLLGWLLGSFALLGLLLAALGIHGVIAGFVAERTNEFGVRFALGAQMRDILRLVLGLGLRLGLAGLLIGLAGAAGVARLLHTLVPELPANDPALLAVTAFTLLAVAALAGWLPARRASRVDPMVALRHE